MMFSANGEEFTIFGCDVEVDCIQDEPDCRKFSVKITFPNGEVHEPDGMTYADRADIRRYIENYMAKEKAA